MEEMCGKQALIEKLTHEMAILKRLKFAASSEAYSGEQQRMLFKTLDTDIEAMTAEIEQLAPTKPAEDDGKKQPKRNHLPFYRQSGIFGRAGLAIPNSTLAQWVGVCGVQLQPLVDALSQELLAQPVLHADETPVAMLKPGNGKTHRAYLWSYCSTSMSAMKAVVFDFAESRAGRHAGDFLGDWRGTLAVMTMWRTKRCSGKA